ncbi:MAG: T9SS type A sorting domain-containing protein [Bacteroidia bacterium]|nr:T9SS type A sorting domain-containing protein [Bacteroidia bacterium]
MKYFYKALLVLAIGNLNAQTLTQSFNEPIVGDVDKNYKMDTSAYTAGLPVSITGSNCVWNFGNMNGIYPMVIDSFISPLGATGATAYPSASYVQHRDILYTYYKSTTSPQQTELLGAYSPSLSLTFTNSAIIAGYPVNYGYFLSDPVSGSFKYNTTNGACNGSITISADGLGTVNFPNNVTIPNVLRLKSVEILTLSIGILPFGTFNQTVYNYYKPSQKFPILSINYTTYQLLAGTPTITAVIYGNNNYFTVAGIKSELLNSDENGVHPNPFSHQLFLNSKKADEDNRYLFYNASGQLALETKDLNDSQIEALRAGIYFLEIKNARGTVHQKIVKE